MKNASFNKYASSGFTLVELIVVICVVGVLSAIAIPRFMEALPRYRLKAAARDLYSSMQKAKLGAVKEHKDWALVFDPVNDNYYLCSSAGADSDWATLADNTVEESVSLAGYKSGVGFGTISGLTVFVGTNPGPDGISYATPDNVVRFTFQGQARDAGYCYLINEKNNENYAVGTTNTGLVSLVRWNGSVWE